jgi:hypothetical protein
VTLVFDQEIKIRNKNLLAEIPLGKSTKIWRNGSTFWNFSVSERFPIGNLDSRYLLCLIFQCVYLYEN